MKLRKIIYIANRNTGTIKTVFLVSRWNYFENRYDSWFRTVTLIKMPTGEYRRFENEVMA